MATIGYYVHHHGTGHEHRFRAIAACMPDGVELVPLSERPILGGVHLPSDVSSGPALDPTAGAMLHWAPIGAPEAVERLRDVVDWIDRVRPVGVVVDVSVEMLLLCRLAGVRTIAVRQHGDRGDPGHRLGYACASRLLAPYPAELETGARSERQAKTDYAGFITFGGGRRVTTGRARIERDDAVVLWGSGGGHLSGSSIDALASVIPGRVFCAGRAVFAPGDRSAAANVIELGWVEDPAALLSERPLVVGSSGNNVVALVAENECPFVAAPQPRPFDEQVRLAEALVTAGAAVLAPERADRAGWAAAIAVARRRCDTWRTLTGEPGAAVAAQHIVRCLT